MRRVLALAGAAVAISAAAQAVEIQLQIEPEARATPPGGGVVALALPSGTELDGVLAPRGATVLGTGFLHGRSIGYVDVATPPSALVGDAAVRVRVRTVGQRLVQAAPGRDALAVEQVRRLVANPAAVTAWNHPAAKAESSEIPTLDGHAFEMLVLTSDDLVAAFDAYAQARTRLGFPTLVRSLSWVAARTPHGADLQETLRTFVRQAYEQWGIRALLLGGDTDVIPTRHVRSRFSAATDAVPTDLYYACLDGSWNADGDADWGEGFVAGQEAGDAVDLLPEIVVGRLPVRAPADVDAYRRKLEAYLEPSVLDYQHKLVFLAEVLWPSAYTPGAPILKNGADITERIIRRRGFGANQVHRLYETPSVHPEARTLTRDAALAELEASAGLVTHVGHGFRYTMSLGDKSLTNVQAGGLTNASRPFFLHMLNCTAAAFDFPCLAERFVSDDGGAVAVIGAAREAYADNLQLYQEAWFEELFQDAHGGAAAALQRAGLRHVAATFEEGPHRWSQLITAYLGDPLLEVWRRAPRQVEIQVPAPVMAVRQRLEVQVTEAGAPVADARVCASQLDGAYALAATDAHGVAIFELLPRAGWLDVVVCGADILPRLQSIPVLASAGPSLRLAGRVEIRDAPPDGAGNGNGNLEAGEQAALVFNVCNDGGASASTATLLVTSTDPAFAFDQPLVDLGTVPAGATVPSPPVAVRAAAGLGAPRLRHVDVVLEARGWTWTDRAQLDAAGPLPQVVALHVRDADADGVPQPGETYGLDVVITNAGFGQLDAVSASLFSTDPDVRVHSGTATLAALGYRASGTLRFRVEERDVSTIHPMLVVLIDAQARTWSFAVDTRQPLPPGALHLDPSAGPGIVALRWAPSPSSDVVGYHVYRTSGAQPWQRASPDLVRTATAFRDAGLQGSTTYRYAVSAVDASGNESRRNPPRDVRTNPASLAGWPRPLAEWSSSAPVVVDLDGDGHSEVVAGADRLYAWSAHGVEVHDGDADPATAGVWSPHGSTFTADLAAADLDGDGRSEVVACTWDGSVFVLDAAGAPAPGWPRRIVSTLHGIWAAPALADLDADSRLEVIVLGLDGRLYAWHADGTEVHDGDADPTTDGVLFVVPGNATWSRGAPAVADVAPDAAAPTNAAPEIVFGTRSGWLYALHADGRVVSGWPRQVGGEASAAITLGDIDGDGGIDIAAPAHDSLYVLRGDGSDLPGWPRPFASRWNALLPSVALHDFDADGRLELVAASCNGATDDGQLWLFDAGGNVGPGWPVDVASASQASPLIADVDGDGAFEILHGGESGLLYAFHADASGAPGFPIRCGAEIRATPTLADVDADGRVDIVLSGWDQQVSIYAFTGASEPRAMPWPMHKGNARRDGLYVWQGGPITPPTPARTLLHANVPNPFNPATTLRFDVAGTQAQAVRLAIFDVRGRLVRMLVNAPREPGRHEVVWTGQDATGTSVPSGIYIARLEAGTTLQAHKVTLLR